MFASTKGGGMLLGFPNVCKVAAAPSPIPTPLPSIAQCADADAMTCSLMVQFAGKAVIMVNSEIPMSNGDEAGKSGGGGVMSSTAGDKVSYKSGSVTVKIEGQYAGLHLQSVTAHNGANANMPAGNQLAPGQVKVMIMS